MRLAIRHHGARDRAVDLVETVRPLVSRAVNDPRVHDALRHAVHTGREVASELSGQGPGGAARRLVNDHALRQRVTEVAAELRSAAVEQAAEERTGRIRRWRRRVILLAVAAAGVTAIVVVLTRRRDPGEGQDEVAHPA